MSTYAERQAYRDAHPGVVVDNNSSSDGGFHSDTPNGTPSTGATSSGGGGGGNSSSGGSNNDAAARAAVVAGAAAAAGTTLADIAERKRQFDANLEWAKQMWANQGMPELQIKQQAAQLARDEFEQQKKVVADNLALAQRAQAAQESQFGATMGLDYLKTAASMGGPADVFQADDFTRGAAASGQVPAFLKALQTNTGLAGFGATSGAAPTPLTPGVIAGRLTSGVPSGGQNNAALTAIGGIAQAGGGALSPQALEQLNPDEMAAMGSGFKKLGYSLPAFLQTYQQSRIGQGAAQAA